MTKTKILKSCIAAFGLTLALSGVAHAVPASMSVIGRANPPIGAYEFCRDNPSECDQTYADVGPVNLTEASWKEILKVNYQVNSTVVPMTDQDIYGVEEKWAYPQDVGDCEDYALEKRKLLIQVGFSPSDLLITVVLQPNGDGHAVLTVRTDRGDFILDNMQNKVMLWSETAYRYLKRQSVTSAAGWDKIQDGRATVVGSVGQ
ncbi:transglutaminase-like cysteine peptidase [Gellertiella hungarica]|uniref:Putative transglutaminase-like cysteine proteinase n=1 Tax=Gellertiella hungarica TaxID=1572859 RepID=A0A7W6J6L8_9HYPH|nr:transglutaminase-like cysteine peptidase [Gellertiella hungarica]MBB4064878.1 putative transglutaminase-like cysteine proteinase [Gellertiella hungarica]